MTRYEAEMKLKCEELTVREEYEILKQFPELAPFSSVAKAMDAAFEVYE